MFLCLYFLLARMFSKNSVYVYLPGLLFASVKLSFCPMIPFPLGDPVYRRDSVSVALFSVGYFLPAFLGVLFSLSRTFLSHESHTSSLIGFHICRGVQ